MNFFGDNVAYSYEENKRLKSEIAYSNAYNLTLLDKNKSLYVTISNKERAINNMTSDLMKQNDRMQEKLREIVECRQELKAGVERKISPFRIVPVSFCMHDLRPCPLFDVPLKDDGTSAKRISRAKRFG